jgi:hypothetical protein
MLKRLFARIRTRRQGQSFVELMLVALILAFMLAGVVEFGFLLNNYLKVLDGTREGARFSSSSEPFKYCELEDVISKGCDLGTIIDSDLDFFVLTVQEMIRVMSPIVLNGNRGDDIIISIFSVAGSSITRWPESWLTGWSLCGDYSDSAFQDYLDPANWNGCSAQNTQFSDSQILGLMDPGAPESGVLLVEIYYHYPQQLKFPVYADVFPDPIPVYTYSVMPISAAEPTPTP